MSTNPKPELLEPPPPKTDISDADRQALLRETLQGLQDAFSEVDDEDDVGTATELHQNAAQAVPDPMEPTP